MNVNVTSFIQKIIPQKECCNNYVLDKYKSFGTHWITLYKNGNNVIYFDNFGDEHVSKEIKKFIRNENITNICRMPA